MKIKVSKLNLFVQKEPNSSVKETKILHFSTNSQS